LVTTLSNRATRENKMRKQMYMKYARRETVREQSGTNNSTTQSNVVSVVLSFWSTVNSGPALDGVPDGTYMLRIKAKYCRRVRQ
jgi:hypothetical protein